MCGNENMADEWVQALDRKIDVIIRLLAQNLVRDMKTQKEKILLLSSIGYKPIEIANFLGTTNNTVSVALTKAKKEGLL